MSSGRWGIGFALFLAVGGGVPGRQRRLPASPRRALRRYALLESVHKAAARWSDPPEAPRPETPGPPDFRAWLDGEHESGAPPSRVEPLTALALTLMQPLEDAGRRWAGLRCPAGEPDDVALGGVGAEHRTGHAVTALAAVTGGR